MADPQSADRTALQQAMHRLLNDIRTADIPKPFADNLRLQAEAMIEQIAPMRHNGPYSVEQLRPPGLGVLTYSPADLGWTIPYGPVLGRLNPAAPPSHAWVENGAVEGWVRFSPIHAGPIGMTHGGALGGLVDEIMSLAVMASGRVAYTRSLNLDFHHPTPLEGETRFRAECAGRSGPNLLVGAEVRVEGKLTLSATGVFKYVAEMTDDFYASAGTRLAPDPV